MAREDDLMTGTRGWTLVAGVVVAIDATARPGETLSEQMDRWLVTHPKLTIGGTLLIAGHLLNILPPAVDPVHRLAVLIARKAEL